MMLGVVALLADAPPDGGGFKVRLGRSIHSDATLYISLVILHTKYTEGRQKDSNVHA